MKQNSFLIVGLVVTITLLLAVEVTPSKILVLTFFSSKSHKITYMPLIEELASRGHEITIITPVKAPKPVKNIREIFTVDVEKYMDEQSAGFDPFEMKRTGKNMNPFLMVDVFGEYCRSVFKVKEVQNIVKEDFDLVFVQPLFNDCAFGIIHRLKAPLVIFAPTSVPDMIANRIGNHFPPSYVSNIFLGYGDEMNFFQRFVNFGTNIAMEAILRFYYEPRMAEVYREFLGQDIPLPSVILGNASLILSNGHFSLAKPKPYLPNVIDVGGLHSSPAKPLPKDLESFISQGKDGFIYFSMGSAIRGSQMPDEKRKVFLKVFSKLKQQVIWKWETETMPDLPKNVKLGKWLPQQDLLGHPKAKMFITHCGGGSTDEAIYHGVPLLGMPMFGDQNLNAENAQKHGFLHKLDWNDLNEEKLMAGIQEILNNPSYGDNVKRLSKVFTDQPNHPLERGVFWVEYVLRHKGAPQLKSPAKDMNYFQYHSWDVIAVYLAIIATALKLLWCIGKFIGRKVCGCFGGSKVKVPKTSITKKMN